MFKAMSMVALHNYRAGGRGRERILKFSDYCMQAMSERFSYFYLFYLRLHFGFKLMMFENCFSLYERLFGFMRVSMDGKDGNLLEEVVGGGSSLEHPNR